jgi:hypothetical protein
LDLGFEQWRGFKWKHGPFPRELGSHDHCLGCSCAVVPGDHCYFFREDVSDIYAGEDLTQYTPPLITAEEQWKFLHDPTIMCEDCFLKLASKMDWSVVPESEPDPVYPRQFRWEPIDGPESAQN